MKPILPALFALFAVAACATPATKAASDDGMTVAEASQADERPQRRCRVTGSRLAKAC